MWTVIKIDNKKLQLLKQDFRSKLDKEVIFYQPKFQFKKMIKQKFKLTEIDLLKDYIFCYHKTLENEKYLKLLKFSRGLKYFLEGYRQSQEEIKKFISYCKKLENKEGYISKSFFEINLNSKYEFFSGPFVKKIFEIVKLQKNKITILMNGINTTIDRKSNNLFRPL